MTKITISTAANVALTKSIGKWQQIMDDIAAGRQHHENGYKDCALCELFHPVHQGKTLAEGCNVCPIKKDTGKNFCADTPYEAWDNTDEDHEDRETLENATKMRDYLVDLQARATVE